MVLVTEEWFSHTTETFITSGCRYKEVRVIVAVAVAGYSSVEFRGESTEKLQRGYETSTAE